MLPKHQHVSIVTVNTDVSIELRASVTAVDSEQFSL